MSDKITISRGERWGIKLAHGTKWGIRGVKKLDRYCTEKAKEKGLPGWLGHLPKIIIITILILIAVFNLPLLFIIFCLYLLLHVKYDDTSGILDTPENPLFNDDPLVERTYDNVNSIDDGAPYGESHGTWGDN